MKTVVLRIAVPEEKAEQIAEELFKDARDMYGGWVVVLNTRVVDTTREDQMIYEERTSEG